MDLEPVRDAYSSMSEQYIGLFAGGRQAHEDDTALVRRHLTRLPGPVLDLGCGSGHWTAYLHSSGADVTGVDMVPEFIAHVRATHRGPEFRLGSMTELDVPEHRVAGDSDDEVASFDHKVITAYRRPVDVFTQHLEKAGVTEPQRLRQQFPTGPEVRRHRARAS